MSDIADTVAFQLAVRVYWEDTDAGGIVYHSNYVNFMERARTEWLRSLGLSQSVLQREHGGIFVVSSIALRYLQAARLDDLLTVTACAQAVKGASITMQQLVYRSSSEDTDGHSATPVLLCEGAVKVGWVDSQSLRPGRIPESVLKQLS